MYIDEATATAYVHDYIMDTSVWDSATSSNRVKALRLATRAIDNLSFKGWKTDIDQVLQFPRNGLSIIPAEIQMACVEIANTLLDGVDTTLAEENLATVVDAYATVRSTYDTNIRQDHIRAGIHNVTAWKLLLPFLNDPNNLILRRG